MAKKIPGSMGHASIEIQNLPELLSDFNRAPGLVRDEAGKAMKRAAEQVRNIAQTYPPTRPGQTYRRTMTLGRRWHIRVKTSTVRVEGTIDNPTPYGPFVMSDEYQAWMHEGRWKTETGVAKAAEDDVNDFFDEALANVRKKLDEP
jgi:hypothetical protein